MRDLQEHCHLSNYKINGVAQSSCGFVMSELSWAGVGRFTQVVASGLLFGLAQVGWSTLGTGFNLRLFLGTVIPTAEVTANLEAGRVRVRKDILSMPSFTS